VSLLSGEENEVCRLYRERLTADLRQHTRYVVLERENLDALLLEIEMSHSDLSPQGAQLEVGRMLGAEALVSLTIAELAEGTELFVRVTEVETARILYARGFRDFADAPAGRGNYDPERELTVEDYSPEGAQEGGAGADADGASQGAAVASGTAAGAPPVILQPESAERSRKLSTAYRAALLQQRQELDINGSLYGLKSENPQLYEALVRARRGLAIIAQDREMLLLFVFHSPRLTERLRDRYPVLARRLYPRFQRLRAANPGKDAFVRGYLRRYGRLLARDRLLAELVRQRFDSFVREQ
jgi:hypothetical protein